MIKNDMVDLNVTFMNQYEFEINLILSIRGSIRNILPNASKHLKVLKSCLIDKGRSVFSSLKLRDILKLRDKLKFEAS